MVEKKFVVFGAVVFALALIALFLFFPAGQKEEQTGLPFVIHKYGNAGGNGFVLYSASGEGMLTLLSYPSKPSKSVFVVKESGFGNEKFQSFVDSLRGLEHLGFNITEITPATEVTDGVLVIPTGAMPAATLKSVSSADPSRLHVIYVGKKDMVLEGTVKQSEWFSGLSSAASSAVSVIDLLPDEMVEKELVGQLANEIAEARWAVLSNKTVVVGAGQGGNMSATFAMNNGTFMRVIPSVCAKTQSPGLSAESECYRQVFDFNVSMLQGADILISGAVFPWEKAEVLVYLNKTNGTANMRIEKDGALVELKELERVTEEEAGIIPLRVGFSNAGDYIITVSDNSGDIGSAILHVKSLSIKLNETRDGLYHQFDVLLDGEKADGLEFNVSLLNSTEKKKANFLVTGGSAIIPAKLGKGINTFVFEGLGGEILVEVNNTSEGIYDIYLKYGPIGLILVIIAYIAARLGRKPIYIIRVGDTVTEKRQNLAISSKKALGIIQACRNELSITGPITATEFATGIKKHFTDGADITEGNAEVILRRMETLGLVEGRNGFYQLSGEGDVRGNALKRQIREKLIAKGIHFDVNGDKFLTKDFEIGFFDDVFSKKKKAMVVFEDMDEIKKTLSDMSDRDRSILFLKEFNGVLELLPVDKLEDVL